MHMAVHFADPKSNVLQLGLHEGMRIADLGAGSGHYALYAAAAVGDDGRVYAIDIQEDVLAHLKDSARRMGLKNVETIWGDFEKLGGTRLKDHVLDAAILSNVLFQIERHDTMLQELRRILKPGGKFVVIDWSGSYEGMGPAPEHVVTEHKAEELFITAGFHKVKGFRAGPHHYGIIFKNPD
jgi:ubiquinone/menaquinone biosynthesis C-methylase UbiE